ncbi:variable surface protein, partial [Plasmodium gonderi]
MGGNIYEIVKEISEYKNIIGTYSDSNNRTTYNNNCNNVNNEISYFQKCKDEEICHKFMYYLNELEGKYNGKDAGCIYLYYWLYVKCNGNCVSTEIIESYINLIKKYESEGDTTMCTKYEKNDISK